MAISDMESAYLQSWGWFTGSVEVSMSASTVFMQCTLSSVADTENSYGYIVGIAQYQVQNFFGGPTTHNFTGDPWNIPNSIFDYNVINVSFYITTWNDDFGFAVGLGNIFFLN
jgi:hypothetical protein